MHDTHEESAAYDTAAVVVSESGTVACMKAAKDIRCLMPEHPHSSTTSNQNLERPKQAACPGCQGRKG